MTTSHTPAPWILYLEETTEEGGMPIRAIDPADGMRFRVADVYGINTDTDHCETSKANARLISAAPELLDALIAAEQAFVEHGIPLSCHASLLQIRAAIDKATGEAQ